PGIRGLLQFRPETGRPLMELVEVLLRGPSTLSRGERELIASYVSTGNRCDFCARSHGAFAAAQLPDGTALVDQVREDLDIAPVPAKLKALLRIAEKVRRDGREVTAADVADARAAGASELEVHDTVLIAAAFCMLNRYVDGLAAVTPDDPEAYAKMAERIVARGYLTG
ncbi:MAG TPA: peroxidase-related enzyme, partial [Actinomycetota bacterium]